MKKRILYSGGGGILRQPYLHMRVWWTEGRRWKTWLLTARLCSKRNGSSTTPSLTGNVSRSSSLGLARGENNMGLTFNSPLSMLHTTCVNGCVYQIWWDAHLEGVVVLSYLVSCQVEMEASHPGLATGREESHFLGS